MGLSIISLNVKLETVPGLWEGDRKPLIRYTCKEALMTEATGGRVGGMENQSSSSRNCRRARWTQASGQKLSPVARVQFNEVVAACPSVVVAELSLETC